MLRREFEQLLESSIPLTISYQRIVEAILLKDAAYLETAKAEVKYRRAQIDNHLAVWDQSEDKQKVISELRL